MELQGSRTLPISREQAWQALNDPEVLKACIPGCDKVEASGEHQYAIGMTAKIGPVSARFNGKVTLSDLNPPESYTLAFDGQGGAAGFGKGQAQVRLEPQGASQCLLSYGVKAQVGGKIAQVGQRLIDGVAKSMAEQFFAKFDEVAQARYAPAMPAAAASAEVAAPAAGAERPGGGLPSWAWWALGAGAAALLLLGWWLK
jgi:carbon monoxide dehydrogenase subunit G